MTMEGTKLFVGNLPSDSTEEELRELFQKYGTLGDVRVFLFAIVLAYNHCVCIAVPSLFGVPLVFNIFFARRGGSLRK